MGTDDRPVGLRQRAARPRGRRCAPFRIDTHAGHQPRRTPRSSTTAATTTPRCWSRRRLGVARRGRRSPHPQFWAPTAPAAGRGAGSAASSRSRPTSRCSTCAGTRPTPSPAGRAARLPTEAEWEQAAAWAPTRRARQPVAGDDGRAAPAGQRRRPARRAPARRRERRAARTRCSATCGSGPRPTSRRYPGFRSFPYREYSEVFFGAEYKVLRGGSWATAPARGAHARSATGTSRSGARSSPASAARTATPDHVPPPRVPRPARRARTTCSSTRRTRSLDQARRPRHQTSRRRRTPTAWASAGTTPTRPEPGALPHASRRSGTTTGVRRARRGVVASGAVLAAARLRVARRRRSTRRGNAPFVAGALAVLAQRHRRRLPRRRRRRAAAARSSRARVAAHRGRRRHRGALRARARPPRRRRDARRDALADVVRDGRARTTGRLNLLLTDGAARSPPPRSATRCSLRRRRRASSPPSRSTTSPAGPRCPTTVAGRARPPDARRRSVRCRSGARMTADVTVDVHLAPDDLRRARSRPTCAPGSPRRPKDAAAEVVLRRPRLRAVRRDHPAARVLPDPRRALDPRRATPPTIAARTGADTLVELGSGTSEKTRLLLDALARRGHAATVRAVRRERGDAARRRGRDRAEYPGVDGARGRRRLRAPPRRCCPRGGRRLVAFLGSTIGNLDARERARVPRRPRRRRSRPATRCCSAPTS